MLNEMDLVTLDAETVNGLAAGFRGDLITPADAGYGGHIWLNRQRPRGADIALWPDRGPNDLFACIGHQGQYIIVSPSQRVTIVRLGITSDDQFPALRRHLADLQEAL